jgi:3-hexulose-6-phosphate synthase
MQPYLWIAYDFTSISQCLSMLDQILEQHWESDLIHEIGRPTLLQAALEGIPIVAEFRQRLNNGQKLVVDFKGYDVPYSAEGQFYYTAGTDLVTVMATAPNEAIQEAIAGAKADHKQVAFDLMACLEDAWKVRRARELADLGATLVSCHTGWNEQATGKTPQALIQQVCHELRGTSTQVIAMGGLKPEDVKAFKPFVAHQQLFAIAVGSAITRSHDPNAAITQFQAEIDQLMADLEPESRWQSHPHPPYSNAPWAAIDELNGCML